MKTPHWFLNKAHPNQRFISNDSKSSFEINRGNKLLMMNADVRNDHFSLPHTTESR